MIDRAIPDPETFSESRRRLAAEFRAAAVRVSRLFYDKREGSIRPDAVRQTADEPIKLHPA
jgi:hypothetical protein